MQVMGADSLAQQALNKLPLHFPFGWTPFITTFRKKKGNKKTKSKQGSSTHNTQSLGLQGLLQAGALRRESIPGTDRRRQQGIRGLQESPN